MLCENCGEKPATLHFTKIINGQKNEMHLCEQCAKEKGEIIPTDTNVFSFPQLLSGLLNFDQMVHGHSPNTSMDPLRCKNCGLTFNQFKKRVSLDVVTVTNILSLNWNPFLDESMAIVSIVAKFLLVQGEK